MILPQFPTLGMWRKKTHAVSRFLNICTNEIADLMMANSLSSLVNCHPDGG
jgi:hypothetical protein